MADNTTGYRNVAVGVSNLADNTTGFDNVAIGRDTLRLNTTGRYNIGIGSYVLFNHSGTTGENIGIGTSALYDLTTGYENIAIGRGAGENLTTAIRNTLIGDDCGYQMTTGSSNTVVGRFTGNNGGLNITAVDNYVVLSNGSGNPQLTINPNAGIIQRRGIAGDSDFSSNLDYSFQKGLTQYEFDLEMVDDEKCRIFQGGYQYFGGSIEIISANSVGQGLQVHAKVLFFARETTTTFTSIGTTSNLSTVNDAYSGTYTDGKFTLATRATNGDSHLTIMNRLGQSQRVSIRVNIDYTG
jgi:hypothetical protein